ncbi:sigma-54-dependent transcriptional regulator [Geosporobacter ferrireducens]|uniref:Stage 0 sporulation protein A homolog n=1 Tax=Geosporobacter ferrireducens TaxID=1424294 RepID=A0A1D8GHX8_9FIRM|nr:sigma-54 dependent transcriptional regulator [Geosporobacter ferrireducens]AOT70521.1 sigma-54-dependent Fis family transcriptional regulator [Geosporobacter ferrireducens]MTI57123.1 sigma-54-dependent Fis family transcriptional regulator [Geosporobacter ferrireducens]
MRNSILIIDDEKNICTSLTYALEDLYRVVTTTNPQEGLTLLKENKFDVILLDLRIGRVSGLEVLKQIKEIHPQIVVIMMTAYGSIDSTIEAIKSGAFTYLTKPLNISELMITIEKALEFIGLNEKVEHLSNALKMKYVYNGILGKSPSMKNIFDLIDKLKDVDTNVLITGESGTGKELVARAIHYGGKRSNEKFVEINCAAIPEGLLEGELFGHKKGSFTGADRDSIGKFEFADKGTILLDEIGDMGLILQAKLLRVLEQKEVTPLGSNIPIKLKARVLASTNRDLKKLMEEGLFRKDLYFRLNVIEIKLPPLREKKEDLPLLFNHFMEVYNKEFGKQVIKLSTATQELLLNYSYPGNIRELSNIMEYGILMAKGDTLELEDLPEKVKAGKTYMNLEYEVDSLVGLPLDEIEKRMIKATLELNKGHRKDTAKMLGISERGLRNKLKEYEL